MKTFCLFFAIFLNCVFLCAAESEYTVVQGNVNKAPAAKMEELLKTVSGFELVKTEFADRNVYFTLRVKNVTAETDKILTETVQKANKAKWDPQTTFLFFPGRAIFFRLIRAEKPTVDMVLAFLQDNTKRIKLPAFSVFPLLENKKTWTSDEWLRLLRAAAELPPSENIFSLVLYCDACGYLDALLKTPTENTKRILAEYRKHAGWYLLSLQRKELKSCLAFLKPSSGEKQILNEDTAIGTLFGINPAKAVFENDTCRIPCGNQFYEFRRINGLWTLTADPVKNPPKNMNYGTKDTDLSSLAPSGMKLVFHAESIHPFLSEYKYELHMTASDGKTKTFFLPLNTGGGTSYDLYRVSADSSGKHGPLLILDGNYGTDILDWNKSKLYQFHRPVKGIFRAVPIEESPFYRKLYIQERTSNEQSSFNVHNGVPTALKGAPPILDVTDWKFLAKRVYAGHIGRDLVFRTSAETPYAKPDSEKYTLDELDPEKQKIVTMAEQWKKLLAEDSVAFYKAVQWDVGSLQPLASFSDSDAWRLFLTFSRCERLSFLADKLPSKEPSNCLLNKFGKLTEGQFAFLVMNLLDVFPESKHITEKNLFAIYSNLPDCRVVMPSGMFQNFSSVREYFERNQFYISSSALFCNLPLVPEQDSILMKLSLFHQNGKGKPVKIQEASFRITPKAFRDRIKPETDGVPFEMKISGKQIRFSFQNADCSGEGKLELPQGSSCWWSISEQGVLQKQEFIFANIMMNKDQFEIRAVLQILPGKSANTQK